MGRRPNQDNQPTGRAAIRNVAAMTVQTVGDNAPPAPGNDAPLIGSDDPAVALYDPGAELPPPDVVYPTDDAGAEARPADPAPKPKPTPAPAPAADPDDVDDPKFNGKSRREIYQAYKELETKLGEQGREVNEVRRMANDLIQRDLQSRQTKPQPAPASATDDKLEVELVSEVLSKPTSFIRRIEERILGQIGAAQAQARVVGARNQHAKVLTDPRFVDWLVANVPRTVAEAADRDPSTLAYIVNQFNAAHPSENPPPANPAPTPPAPASARPAPAPAPTHGEAVRVMTAAAGPAPVKDTGDRQGKIYRSSEIMAQMISNPAEYERNVAEYTRAYEEGRVR